VFLAQIAGWRGVFIEEDPAAYGTLAERYRHVAGVNTVDAYLEPQNVEGLLLSAGVPEDVDVLSIDVDGNDYYLWEALELIRPRLVVIEYNASLDPRVPLVQPYAPEGPDGTTFFGASLAALEALGHRKGYRLVHTELAGVNAFFVRADLAGDKFLPLDDVPRRPPNYYLDGVLMHRPADQDREYVSPPRATT
jgi:hypothetical protein